MLTHQHQPERPEKVGLGLWGACPQMYSDEEGTLPPGLMQAKGGQMQLLYTATSLTLTAAGPGFNGSGGSIIPDLSWSTRTSSHFSSSPCAMGPSVCSGPA